MDSETTAMMAKEDRKQSEWREIINARINEVSSWSLERAKVEAAKFAKNYTMHYPHSLDDRFYSRVDMLRDCAANTLYKDAVKNAAPQIFNKAMIEMVQRKQNFADRELGPKPEYLVELEKETRLHASRITPDSVQSLAKSHIENLFDSDSSIGQKLTIIQICIETSPIYKAEVAQILPEIISVTQRHKENDLRLYTTSPNIASSPYQEGKLKVNLSHAKDFIAPASRSLKL